MESDVPYSISGSLPSYIEDTDVCNIQSSNELPTSSNFFCEGKQLRQDLLSDRVTRSIHPSNANDLTDSHQDNEVEKSVNLKIKTTLESNTFRSYSAHKIWGMVRIDAPNKLNHSITTQIDFVVVIDVSTSMKKNNKLAFVQATIEYMISQLNENHRFCLILFNQNVQFATEELMPINQENRQKLLAILHKIKADGSTNISDAVFSAVKVLRDRPIGEQNRISSIMLFTDGLANHGLRGKKFAAALRETIIPPGLTMNTFGYGLDHDSKMLQRISLSSKGGVYYYIESVESIPSTFGECLAGLCTTVAHNINVRIIAHDGCRVVNFYTRFPVTEHKQVKDYTVSLGSMYSQEARTVLFKLSLRKLEEELDLQQLLTVIVSYTNTITGAEQNFEKSVFAQRPEEEVTISHIPFELDKHINRYTASSSIEEAIGKATTEDFEGARRTIRETIDLIKNSISAKHSQTSQYCDDLIADLTECEKGVENENIFQAGIHYCFAYATMYFLERSTGTSNFIGIDHFKKISDQPPKELEPTKKEQRNLGYGYTTYAQEEESNKAKQEVTKRYITGYLDSEL